MIIEAGVILIKAHFLLLELISSKNLLFIFLIYYIDRKNFMKKKLLFAVSAIFLFLKIKAQTTLSAGDIAIIGYNYDASPQEMSIVTLVNISAGTTIRITDYGYDENTSTFGTTSTSNVNEGSISWTTTSSIAAGTVFKLTITSGVTPMVTGLPGTVSITGWTNSTNTTSPIPAGGDNWFIFQGDSPTSITTFIFAYANPFATTFNGINQPAGQFNVSGSGSPSIANTYLPPSLKLGSSAIALNRDVNSGGYHGDNNIYLGSISGSKSNLLALICSPANWQTNETTTYDIAPGGTNFSGTNPVFNVITPCSAPTSPKISGNASICSGSSTSFTASATGTTGNTTYSWTYPNNTTASGATISNVTLAGTYTCVISNGTGCTASTSTNLTVTPTVNPTISISSDDADNSICVGTSVTFTANITNGGPNPVYKWKVNNNAIGIATSTFTTSNLANNDMVTCELTSTETCVSPQNITSSGITIKVTSKIDSTVTIQNALLTSNEPSANYQWKICTNNQIIDNATNQSYEATTNGQYAVTITKGSCIATSKCIDVTITDLIDNSFSPVALTVFPNPSHGSFTLKAQNEGMYLIHDEIGQITAKINLNASNGFSYSLDGLKEGVYILSGFNNQKMVNQKIVILK